MEKTLKYSKQREALLRILCGVNTHPTADRLYEEIRKEFPKISLATVYRNLKLLSEMGEIRRLEIPGGPDRFDHRVHNHCHVKCEKCGRLFDVDMDYISGLENNIRDSHGFDFTGYDIIFRGICPECKEKPKD